VITRDLFRQPEIQAILRECIFEVHPFDAHLKGIDDRMPLVRLVTSQEKDPSDSGRAQQTP
ncbi:MAG: hypothetical protein O7A08_08040, partial [SAR324 cluster bacterium]|nr:hypothetical protein [SAR324 cluster bacterium]